MQHRLRNTFTVREQDFIVFMKHVYIIYVYRSERICHYLTFDPACIRLPVQIQSHTLILCIKDTVENKINYTK